MLNSITILLSDQTTDIEDGFPRTPQVAPFTSADDTAPLLENGSSDDKLNFDGPMDFNKDLCRSSSFNGTMVGEENAVSMLVPSYSQEQLPEIFVGLKSQQGCIGEMSDVEDETFNTVVSRSSQTCRIDLLEEIIEDAKDNKKILFQTMQSIMNLMKEVELQEAAVEQAKEEAARGAWIFLSRWRNLNRCCHMQRK
ncbi:hypothetical protein E1A91_D09G267400v1 [Gossypium mustelinum]|uniref:Uncharacterized protein n=2 Tax=Gossypium mustelinum TaxID=34275 RepID=A0A5D2TR63_GOSMU|nr:hypothetical protein E1A91_D09G267400v1 [Gossypium mustelinum]